MKIFFFAMIFTVAACAEPVSLTDNQGRTITAEIQSVDGDSVSILRNGKPFVLKISSLDEASQKVVANAKPAVSAPKAVQIRLAGRTVASGRTSDKKWKTSWGSYDRDVYRSKTVQADLEVTSGEGTIVVLVQWIGCPAGMSSDKSIVSTEKATIKAKAGFKGTQFFDAIFVESDAKYAALGIRDRDGSKYTGWILRVVSEDGRILGQQSSNPVYLTSFPNVDLAAASEKPADDEKAP